MIGNFEIDCIGTYKGVSFWVYADHGKMHTWMYTTLLVGENNYLTVERKRRR